MNGEDVNITVTEEDIGEEEKRQHNNLEDQQQQIISKYHHKLVEKQHHQQLVDKQAQGFTVMGGLTTLHVLYEDYNTGLANTRAAKRHCNILVGMNRTEKEDEAENK